MLLPYVSMTLNLTVHIAIGLGTDPAGQWWGDLVVSREHFWVGGEASPFPLSSQAVNLFLSLFDALPDDTAPQQCPAPHFVTSGNK